MTSHLDPDVLALLALGELADHADAQEHLAGCEMCGAELAELRSVVTTARGGPGPVRLADPPAHLWHQIVDELGLTGEAVDLGPLPGGPAGQSPVEQPAIGQAPIEPAPVEQARARSRANARWFRPAALATAAGLAGILIGVLGTQALDSRDEREPKVVASTELGPLPGKDGRASVAVQRTPDGLAVRVRATGLPAARGFYEVWLLDATAKRLISLGALPGTGSASLPVPAGTDLSRYPVLDISLEPDDGDPAHSTNSFIRGSLPT